MKLKRKGVNTMLAKIEFATYMAYWKIKRRLMEMTNEEDGMETLEAVILIGIAVIIGAIIIDKLKGPNGLIDSIFNQIKTQLGTLFSSR